MLNLGPHHYRESRQRIPHHESFIDYLLVIFSRQRHAFDISIFRSLFYYSRIAAKVIIMMEHCLPGRAEAARLMVITYNAIHSPSQPCFSASFHEARSNILFHINIHTHFTVLRWILNKIWNEDLISFKKTYLNKIKSPRNSGEVMFIDYIEWQRS